MGRSPCCSKEGLNRGAWTAQEDQILTDFIKSHGEGRWRNLPKKAGLKRCGKSCRLRWLNYLRPDIKRGNISPDEEELIIRLHKLLGNRWALIAGRIPGRTDNEIKNYWNTILAKKVQPNHQAIAPRKKQVNAALTFGQKTKLPLHIATQPLSKPNGPLLVRTNVVNCPKHVLATPELANPDPAGPGPALEATREPGHFNSSDIFPPLLTENDYNNNNNDHLTDLGLDFDIGELGMIDLMNSTDFLSSSPACSSDDRPEILSDKMEPDNNGELFNVQALASFLDCY